jgi:PilZ domain
MACFPMVLKVATRVRNKNRRRWARLQLAIPVFVRTGDGNGKDSLEFATAINISAGGALIVVRRCLPKLTRISLEIPSAPLGPANGLPNSTRVIRAKTVWVTHQDDYHLLGLKFVRPLSTDVALHGRLRKPVAAV